MHIICVHVAPILSTRSPKAVVKQNLCPLHYLTIGGAFLCRRRAANSFTNRHELNIKTFRTKKFPRFHAKLNEILDINQRLPVTTSGLSLNIKATDIEYVHLHNHDFQDTFNFFCFVNNIIVKHAFLPFQR